ncbi:MAG: hypothetical protein KDA80_15120 [Planctomycetaceae bacterium]|nr:hypothetical protein [Planctomycetaceae bacterium]
MNGLECRVVIGALGNMAVYVPYLLVQSDWISQGTEISPYAIFPWHFLTMILNGVALVLTFVICIDAPLLTRTAN